MLFVCEVCRKCDLPKEQLAREPLLSSPALPAGQRNDESQGPVRALRFESADEMNILIYLVLEEP